MKHEFHARYSLTLQPDFAQQEAVDFLTDAPEQPPKHWGDLGDVADPAARIQLLAQAILTPYKDYARVGTHRRQGGLLHAVTRKLPDRFFKHQSEDFLAPLELIPTLPDIALFPRGAWAINFKFKLQKPYLSKDDTDFYIIDNPVRKEWVFQMPYIAPSQWKGALRAAMVRRLVEWWSDLGDNGKQDDSNLKKFVDCRIQLTRLFGNEKEVALDDKDPDAYLDKKGGKDLAEEYRLRLESMTDTGFFTGNLHFYPTYFTKIGMEVINPHDRETGAGTLPIYFESVPAGADGVFALLYVPVDCIGSNDDAETEKQSAEMLRLVAEGVEAMLTEYGFGAKTSSGFGTAGDGVEDGRVVSTAKWANDLPEPDEGVFVPPDEESRKYLNDDGTVRVEVCGEDGKPLSNDEYNDKYRKEQPPCSGSFSKFRKFKTGYKNYGEAWRKYLQRGMPPAKSPMLEFKSLGELVKRTKKMEGAK